ncbi:hypothetical protein PH7735_01781 [Shimia thalassica]|uniref:Uncharacterized protein n=1 Tax=Shimia thalassica TaxID=1715693 RepID=A0A0P1I794_9RHOB|nr:hypothetical protein [Shimia thalassica]CUJ94737.1 hypothetical protein PH7735_01781 [Shimia thalassica]
MRSQADAQRVLANSAKIEGNREDLLKRAAECRKAGLLVAARELEKAAIRG